MFLIDDRVDRNCRLSCLAIANDQLALATSERDHRVDHGQPGQHRFGHQIPLDNPGRRPFDRIAPLECNGRATIERSSDWRYDAPKQSITDGHASDLAGAANLAACGNSLARRQEHDPGAFVVDGHGQAERTVREAQEFVKPRVRQTADMGNTVANFGNASHMLDLRREVCVT